ncbi:tail tube protein [Klebsiella phage Metamorpho]|nr:tail tube protein [Klebsiella phage Metamorpho]
MELTDVTKGFESGDFARPNLFEVEISHLGRKFSLQCKAAPMPAAIVEKIPVGYMNRKLNVAGDRTYDDWTVTIYNDDKHETRKAILEWQSMAHAMGNEITGMTPADYKKTAIVRHFARDGKTITNEHVITGLWPTNVGEVQMDWDSNNEIETFETTFSIDWWE